MSSTAIILLIGGFILGWGANNVRYGRMPIGG